MACTLLLAYSIHFARILACFSLLAGSPAKDPETEPTLVRVNLITEIRDARGMVELNGKILPNYAPTIIQEYSSTGIVLDLKGNILTFLGYRWVDIQSRNPRIEIIGIDGQKWKGKLIGIDQRNGVAVVKLLDGKLERTAVCVQCEIKDGVEIETPVIGDPGISQYEEAQILSVGTRQGIPESKGLTITMSRPFQDIGQPILTLDHRVLGYVASQDSTDMRTVVYPIDQLLSSAKEILRRGGDIRVGWLGVFVPTDSPSGSDAGIVVQDVAAGSPAHKAGLSAQDSLIKYNGREIGNSRQFVQLVQGTPIGSKASLEIIRGGKPMTITAIVEARKSQPNPIRLSFNSPNLFDFPISGMMPETGEPQRALGVTAYALTPFLANALQMPGQRGLFVANVDKQKPADLAGLIVGDVIVAMDNQPISDAMSFTSFLLTHNWGDRLMLRVLRKGAEHTITIPLPKQNP
jgi:serine protease Do